MSTLHTFSNVVVFDGSSFFQGSVTIESGIITRIEQLGEPQLEDTALLLMPGMINLHTHIPMALFKGAAEDLPLHQWLNDRIFPLEAKFISQDMCRVAGMWGMAELLLSGVTAFADMYFYEEEIAAAAGRIGIRAFIGEGVINFPAPNGKSPEETIEYTAFLAEKYHADPYVHVCAAPHSPYLTHEKYLIELADISKQYSIPFHIHMAETKAEAEHFLQEKGSREFIHFEKLGLLSERVIAAHSVWVDAAEIAAMARAGLTVAHCPSSNLKLGSGIAPVAQMQAAGVPVAVATDGSASGNSLCVLQETELAAKVQKAAAHDPTLCPAEKMLQAVTSVPGRALGSRYGRIIKGAPADLTLIKLDSVGISPVYNPAAALLYAFSRDDIESVWVAGRKVVEQGQLLSIDHAALYNEFKALTSAVRRSL